MTENQPTAAQLARQNVRDGDGKYETYVPTGPDQAVTDALTLEADPLDSIGGDPIDFDTEGGMASFRPVEIGQDADVFMAVDISRDEDGGGFWVEGLTEFRFLDFKPDNRTAAQWIGDLDRKQPAAIGFLEGRYGASVDLPDYEDELEQIRFTVRLEGRDTLTREQAFHALWEQTGGVQFHNESDHGTFGSENLGRLLHEELVDSIVIGDRWAVINEAAEMELADAMLDVNGKVGGTREITDPVAVICAGELLAISAEDTPELRKLNRYGYCNQARAAIELGKIYDSNPTNNDDLARLHMLGTWLVAKRNGRI
ncbi:hypothetical protein [Leifsonia sp. Leaf264]|uniref:hypothetical protein n=1 Tax=Leifsonia sp. Leaf264 TaxID=1736314 RepID=UPI0006FCE714|nr:hypothetical protein [Leifsonia sp. Leaf264]KQO98146.1 hypothetical protein ASF30_08790 [Leifsonia sp. Leaf264]